MSEEKTCETCRHFLIHYIQWPGTHYHQVASGHCVRPRLRLRFAYAKACNRYAERDPLPDLYLR